MLKSPIITVCLSVCIAYNTDHKQGATKLLKLVNNCFLMVTFEKSKNYSIQSEKHNLHSTGIELVWYVGLSELLVSSGLITMYGHLVFIYT